MRTVILISAIVALPFLVLLFMSLMVAMARVWRGGPREAREFARAGVDLRRFLSARVLRQDSSSLVPTRAGIGIRATPDGFVVRETRALSKDVF